MITIDQKSFWKKVAKAGPDECWLWIAGKDRCGYGRFGVMGRNKTAHRIAWTLINGLIPKGIGSHGTCVLHKCDVPACCNPTHLFLGTQRDNSLDRDAKGRRVSSFGCMNGMNTKPERRARGERHGSRTKPESLLRGSAHHGAKLTETMVVDIRRRCANGENQHSLAKEFGVLPAAINKILHRKTWRHVA